MKNLNSKVADLLRDAVNISGQYNPDENFFYIEERLTIEQAIFARAFLEWVHKNGKKFGRNVPEVYLEFVPTEEFKVAQKEKQAFDNAPPMTLTEVKITEFQPRSKK